MKPGATVRPERSSSRAPSGRGSAFWVSIDSIRSPLTRIATSRRGGPPPPSIRRPTLTYSGFGGSAAAGSAPGAAAATSRNAAAPAPEIRAGSRRKLVAFLGERAEVGRERVQLLGGEGGIGLHLG